MLIAEADARGRQNLEQTDGARESQLSCHVDIQTAMLSGNLFEWGISGEAKREGTTREFLADSHVRGQVVVHVELATLGVDDADADGHGERGEGTLLWTKQCGRQHEILDIANTPL